MNMFTSSQQTNSTAIATRLRPWLPVLMAVVILLCIYQLALAVYVSQTTGTLLVNSPDTSITITISQKERQAISLTGKRTQRIRLKPGTYQIITSKDRNQSTSSVIIYNKQLVSFTAKAPADKNKLSESSQQANKLIGLLPFTGPEFRYRVDYSYQFSSTQAEPTIIITAPTDQATQDALDWIKSQGYDPLVLPIKYVTAQL